MLSKINLVSTLILLTSQLQAQIVVPGFTMADTICVNEPLTITNTTTGASNYYWSFCSADLTSAPEIQNLGNPGNNFNQPVFMDYLFTNNQYYGFITNYSGGNLVRLDYGTSLLNVPTLTNLGNFNGVLATNVGSEGIQIVQNEGKWYVIIVSGGNNPKIVKIAFGANITNPTPVATDWGNIGTLSQPIDLHVFKEGNNWYGFTVNADNSTITRFNFGTSFENTPTANNLGNIGNLSYPTGIYAVNSNGQWHLFISNGGDNSRSNANASLTRLDFGTSLLNTPTGTNLGSLGGQLKHPRDLAIFTSCDKITGFAVNGSVTQPGVVRFDFTAGITSTPSATTIASSGFQFPHSISKLFRVNEDVYAYITDAQNNTISRMRFRGCTNASIASSTAVNPPVISYNTIGTYNVNLTVDLGLPTQTAFCKEVVVVNCVDNIILSTTATICKGKSYKIETVPATSYMWTPALYLDDPTSPTPLATPPADITYYVAATIPGVVAPVIDSIHIVVKKPFIKTNEDTTICAGQQVPLNVRPGTFFTWTPAAGLTNTTIQNPVATPSATTKFIVSGTDANGCAATDSVVITVLPLPVVTISPDTLVCKYDAVQLHATGGGAYTWFPAAGLSDAHIANPIATVTDDVRYRLTVTNNGCSAQDAVDVNMRPVPFFAAAATGDICEGSSVILQATGGTNYLWSPAAQVAEPTAATTVAIPAVTTSFAVNISEQMCGYDTTISLPVNVHSLPELSSLPNAFTPNGDGRNDCFGIKKAGNTIIDQFNVYNRWGQIIFKGTNSQLCWDGTFKGIRQETGTYIYIIRARTICGDVSRKGIINLIR